MGNGGYLMANTATVALSFNVFGPSGAPAFADTISESSVNSPGPQMAYAFATGDNVITVPTGCVQLIIWGITGTVTLKGNTGDTGIPLGTTLATKIPVSGSSVLLTASAGATGNICWL